MYNKEYWSGHLTQAANNLNVVRKALCAYGAAENQSCDCKYGAPQGIPHIGSEKTGCPELRDLVKAYRKLAEHVRQSA